LKVIPVIDVLNGVVVHAVRGKRREYKPLHSMLCNSIEPLEVAENFHRLGFSELYLADLDAIINGVVNLEFLKRIAALTGLKLMVDAGVTDIKQVRELLDYGVSRVVIGTETLDNKNFLGKSIRLFGNIRIIVSLDLKGDTLIAKPEFDGSREPTCLIRELKAIGVRSVIVLDLTRVGSDEGVSIDFLKQLLREAPIDVYVGGGVRDINDLLKLKELGVSGTLVATALHTGKISINELKESHFV
jgi:phosphoribosylformimino-5-aminoimidazole carboxamide ribotide isomerase